MPQQRPAPSSKPHRGLLPLVQPLPAPHMAMTNSGVYLGFHFGRGGGGSKYFWKSGVICMALCHAFARGFGGMISRIFFKWCVLENILLKYCKKKNGKNINFLYIKIIDNVLLCTFPTPPEKISTPLNFSQPPPPKLLNPYPKISQPPPPKLLNPPPKISQPLLKIFQPHSKKSQPSKIC